MANRKTARKHALTRMKSRYGVSDRNVAMDLIKEVLEKGVRVIDLPPSPLQNLLFYKYKSNTMRKKIYVYDDKVYIFSKGGVLITTYTFEQGGIKSDDTKG
jgi:hypothetical protein